MRRDYCLFSKIIWIVGVKVRMQPKRI